MLFRSMLKIRERLFGSVPEIKMVAGLAKQFNVPKKHVHQLLQAFETEKSILGNDARTAFGLSAAVTRFGQKLDDDAWRHYDVLGGKFVAQTDAQWNSFREFSNTLDDKAVKNLTGIAV